MELESKQVHWAAINKDEYCESSPINNDPILLASSFSSSYSSSCLSSSSELVDDASSSSTSSNPSPPSNGPLYELDDLMTQLPIVKRGLSKFYNGKSQTFASLGNAKSVEDLAKKELMSCSRRMKSCKSFGGNLNHHHHKFGPKPTITKRSPKMSSSPYFGTKPCYGYP